MTNNKNHTTITELLTDEGFFAWYLRKNETQQQAWDEWIAAKPEHAELAMQAKQILAVLIKLETENVSDYQRKISFDRILNKIRSQEKESVDL